MRCFSTFRARLGAVPGPLPLMAAAWLLCACNAGNSPAGAGSNDALKGGITAHGEKSKGNGDEHGGGAQAGAMAEHGDDDASVDEGKEHGKDAGQPGKGKVKKPKKHDQDSGVDEDKGSDEDKGNDEDDQGDEH